MALITETLGSLHKTVVICLSRVCLSACTQHGGQYVLGACAVIENRQQLPSALDAGHIFIASNLFLDICDSIHCLSSFYKTSFPLKME